MLIPETPDCERDTAVGAGRAVKALANVFGAEIAAEVWNRFTIDDTPTHGSWLNQAEIEIGIFLRQCLGIDACLTSKLCAKKRRPGTGA